MPIQFREKTGFARACSVANPRAGAALLLGLAGIAVGQAAEGFSFAPTTQNTAWQVSWNQRPVMVYAFAPTQFKPYVKELSTLTGVNILRDAPSDHLHHHALMYAIRVNGINFWEEVPGSGVQRVVKTTAPIAGKDAQGHPTASLTQTIHWVATTNAFLPDTSRAALLVEDRTLTVTINEASQEAALQWQSSFTVGSSPVTLGGANYFGLGMRFRSEFDAVAKHLNAGGAPDLSDGKQDVSAHPWGSVSFDAAGLMASVAVYGDPKNAHGNACYFTMQRPFAYLAATQGLEKEEIKYAPGEKFNLNYLVAVWPAARPAEAISARGKQWLEKR